MDVALLDRSTDSTDDIEELDPSERRTLRAKTEPMLVVPEMGLDGDCIGMYRVHSISGEEYIVEATTPDTRACTCADYRHREPEGGCKHIRRVVLMQRSEGSVPAAGGAARERCGGPYAGGERPMSVTPHETAPPVCYLVVATADGAAFVPGEAVLDDVDHPAAIQTDTLIDLEDAR